jgi:hypothetical protein
MPPGGPIEAGEPAPASTTGAPVQPPPGPPRTPAKPVSGLSILFGALLDRIRRLFKRKT